MSEPIRLYGITEIAKLVGITRESARRAARKHESLRPQFVAPTKGDKMVQLWAESGLGRWRVWFASVDSDSCYGKLPSYSTLLAVNYVGPQRVTWKLWWRNLPDGCTQWFFSTPVGWFTSRDYGKHWDSTGSKLLDSSYQYFCVNTIAAEANRSWVANVLRSADSLRRVIEKETA